MEEKPAVLRFLMLTCDCSIQTPPKRRFVIRLVQIHRTLKILDLVYAVEERGSLS
jgi:hypothetical protein